MKRYMAYGFGIGIVLCLIGSVATAAEMKWASTGHMTVDGKLERHTDIVVIVRRLLGVHRHGDGATARHVVDFDIRIALEQGQCFQLDGRDGIHVIGHQSSLACVRVVQHSDINGVEISTAVDIMPIVVTCQRVADPKLVVVQLVRT